MANKVLFKSGFKLGGGLTFQLDSKIYDGITYMVTPGLADVKLRMEAAQAISKALKQDGIYQIFFVIKLEAGRIRPEDMATIRLVLDSSKDIKYYSIIINKLSSKAYDCLAKKDNDELKTLIGEVTKQIKHIKNLPAVLLLKMELDLLDHEDKIVKLDDLDKFAKEAPCTTVAPDSVEVMFLLRFCLSQKLFCGFLGDVNSEKMNWKFGESPNFINAYVKYHKWWWINIL